MDNALRQQEAHHVERTKLLLEQHQQATRSRTDEILKSKSVDHDSHMLSIKNELAEGHRENLSRELAHQREQLRRQHEAEKAELTARFEEKRLKDLAEQARAHEEALEECRESVKDDHADQLRELDAAWQARREEAVKVSARNLHEMHQEALRRALYEKDRQMEEILEKITHEKDAHQVEILQQLATQRDEEHNDRLQQELEAQDAEHKAIMDQLVKEKLDADKAHRDEMLDMKEHISQLETKLHIDKTSSQQDIRRHGDRLSRFCDWVADQQIHVSVETSMGDFKQGTIQVLDSETGTAAVNFSDGTKESAVSLSRISFKPVEIEVPVMMESSKRGGGGADSDNELAKPEITDVWGIYENMNSTEKTLMFVMPMAVFPIVLATLAILLKFVYAPLS
jgi:myosin heavy subunit